MALTPAALKVAPVPLTAIEGPRVIVLEVVRVVAPPDAWKLPLVIETGALLLTDPPRSSGVEAANEDGFLRAVTRHTLRERECKHAIQGEVCQREQGRWQYVDKMLAVPVH